MTPLSREFIDNCPVHKGFRMRGIDMTRIEVFVDAAFAFAVTMLVISFDAIPRNWDELVVAIKSIPAFVVAVAQLMWIWYEHSVWSKRYGLDDAMTVFLSAILVIVMLIYIYPMRLMAAGMFSWFTQGYLPQSFDLRNWDQLAGMFVFLGIGFFALCAVFVLLYGYAARLREELGLSGPELYETHTVARIWAGSGVIGLLSVIAALSFADNWVPFAGFVYVLLGLWIPYYEARRQKRKPESP